jgi:hypothetical protein
MEAAEAPHLTAGLADKGSTSSGNEIRIYPSALDAKLRSRASSDNKSRTVRPPFLSDTLQPARTLRPRPPKSLGMEDGFVLVQKPREDGEEVESVDEAGYVHDIDSFVRSLELSLWPLNTFLHDHPELGYKEHKAHDALASFMESQEGWTVTRSAYGMETAWVAVYDSGKPGPAVSFNAEMGIMPSVK